MVKGREATIHCENEHFNVALQYVPYFVHDILVGARLGEKIKLSFSTTEDRNYVINRFNNSSVWSTIRVCKQLNSNRAYSYHIVGDRKSLITIKCLSDNAIIITRESMKKTINSMDKECIIINILTNDTMGLNEYKTYQKRKEHIIEKYLQDQTEG